MKSSYNIAHCGGLNVNRERVGHQLTAGAKWIARAGGGDDLVCHDTA